MEDVEWKLESKEVLGGEVEKRIRGWGQGIRGANRGGAELEHERGEEGGHRETVFGAVVFLQPGYDEWPADSNAQLSGNISVVYILPSVIHHLFFASALSAFCIQQTKR